MSLSQHLIRNISESKDATVLLLGTAQRQVYDLHTPLDSPAQPCRQAGAFASQIRIQDLVCKNLTYMV
jgi:hypothetical protein